MKKSNRLRLLNSSVAGVDPIALKLPQAIFSNFSVSVTGTVGSRSTTRGPVCVLISKEVECPPLDDEAIRDLNSTDSDSVTKHLNLTYLKDALAGEFRFGTTYLYKPSDDALVRGRLGDAEESTQREVFSSRSGFIARANFHGGTFQNMEFGGSDNHVVIEYAVNDYCSCLSRGSFDPKRAALLRSKGNEDLGAYVTYDLSRLKAALQEIMLETIGFQGRALIGRSVEYGSKDRKWMIEERFKHEEDRDPLAIWLGTTFVKARDYLHEDEFRLLITDPAGPGRLSKDTCYHSFQDSRIADAIVSSGSF